MTDLIKAIRTDVLFGAVSVDAYKLQNYHFEKRIGFAGAGISLGYSKEWFGRLPKNGAKQIKAMQDDGFDGCQVSVLVPRPQGGTTEAKTISLRDFNKLIAYEALKKKNTQAIILLIALSEAGLERVITDAFNGVPLDWFGEKIVHYSQWSYEDLEKVLQYNREEVNALYPWGLPVEKNSHPDE